MKKVECIIRPEKLEEVIVAVEQVGINGLNITQIAGYGNQKGKTDTYRGVEYEVKFKEKLKVEIVVKEDEVDELVETVIATAQTGEVGDGKIFIYPIEEAVRIRTEEIGKQAI